MDNYKGKTGRTVVSTRKVVGVSLSSEAYSKLRLLGAQLGLKDSQAAKHLIMMSLQQLMGQLQQVEQGSMLREMTTALTREMGAIATVGEEVAPGLRRLVLDSAGASNTGTEGQKCPQKREKRGKREKGN